MHISFTNTPAYDEVHFQNNTLILKNDIYFSPFLQAESIFKQYYPLFCKANWMGIMRNQLVQKS